MQLYRIGTASVLLLCLISGFMSYICLCNASFDSRKALSSHEVNCEKGKNGGNVSTLFKKRKLLQDKARAAKRQARGVTSIGNGVLDEGIPGNVDTMDMLVCLCVYSQPVC